MKRLALLLTGIAGVMLLAATPSLAAEEGHGNEGKEMTIKGEAKCAKCALKEADKCQTVIEAEHNGHKVKYYLADNEVAKKFHEEVCKEPKKVTAMGTVKSVNGKHELTVSKIEVAKEEK
jgi:RecG-like helicase